jgi:dTDP-4-amino-4,6-dideoxygalactose transaminase
MRGKVLDGPEVERFENEFAAYIGSRYALGVSSGRAALYLAFSSLDLAPGDEVIMPAYTFHIVPLVIAACDLKPVFVDVEPDTYNIDCSRIEAHITPRTRVILATHMYGQPCELDLIRQLADKHSLLVIEDCAHALGASYGQQRVGRFGDMAAFTFALAKNMPCFGGGMLTTNDPKIYEGLLSRVQTPTAKGRKRLFQEVGKTSFNYFCTHPYVFPWLIYPAMRLTAAAGMRAFDSEPGTEFVAPQDLKSSYLYRLTNLQASVGLHQLTRIETINATVSRNALEYNRRLGNLPGIKVPKPRTDRSHTFLYYRIEAENRTALRRQLLRQGIDTAPDDMSDCSTLAPFRHEKVNIPVASQLPARLLEVPNNTHMDTKAVGYIAAAIRRARSRH